MKDVACQNTVFIYGFVLYRGHKKSPPILGWAVHALLILWQDFSHHNNKTGSRFTGNPHKYWCPPRESNTAPTDYESAALTKHELEGRIERMPAATWQNSVDKPAIIAQPAAFCLAGRQVAKHRPLQADCVIQQWYRCPK